MKKSTIKRRRRSFFAMLLSVIIAAMSFSAIAGAYKITFKGYGSGNKPTFEFVEETGDHQLISVDSITVNSTTPATCITQGSANVTVNYKYSSGGVIDGTMTDDVVLPALGHDWGEWHADPDNPATCQHGGKEIRICKRDGCNGREERDVDPTDHNCAPSYSWAADYSTCTLTVACAYGCNFSMDLTIDATETVTRQPTEQEQGIRTYTADFVNYMDHNPTGDFAGDMFVMYMAQHLAVQTKNVPIPKLPSVTTTTVTTTAPSNITDPLRPIVTTVPTNPSHTTTPLQITTTPEATTTAPETTTTPVPETTPPEETTVPPETTVPEPEITTPPGDDTTIPPDTGEPQDGDVIELDDPVIPAELLEEIKGKDVDIVIDLGNGMKWVINGKSITDTGNNIDLSLTIGDGGIPVAVINKVTGELFYITIHLNYDGPLPFDAILELDLKKSNAGYYADLFYFNPDTIDLEFVYCDMIDENGIARLNFRHASDYTIVIDEKPYGEEEEDNPHTGVLPFAAGYVVICAAAAIVARKRK